MIRPSRLAAPVGAAAVAALAGCDDNATSPRAAEAELRASRAGAAGVAASAPAPVVSGLAANVCVAAAGNRATPRAGDALVAWACSGGAGQRFVANSAGQLAAANGGLCLDAGGAADAERVTFRACSAAPSQRWTYTPARELRTAVNNKCLDLFGGRSVNGTHAIVWPCHGGANQRWTAPQAPAAPPPTPPPAAPGAGATAVRSGRWSEAATWGGAVPARGAAVTIPVGTSVELDVSTPELGTVAVAGALAPAADRDVELAAENVLVTGALRAGSAGQPHRARFTIALAGDPRAEAAPGLGAKALAVRGSGVLALHGAPRVSWTRLSATAEAGATTLTLARAVDWQPGDRIVVAATGYDARESEAAEVARVEGAQVTLAAPLRFAHWGRTQSVGGRTLDERAEVGLLSHNVRVTSRFGADSLLGGHVIITDDATVQVSDVEFDRLGQPGRLGRYAFHWHLMRDATGTYLRRSSVHRSLQRGVVVHGTDGVEVADNVVYDVRGHGVFVEDGSEQATAVTGNLAALTREVRREHLLAGANEERASNFWFATANLRVTGNAAAGSVHGFGYWYDLATANGHWRRNEANSYTMGEFRDNSAHSQSVLPRTALDYHPMEAGSGLRFDGGDFRGTFRGLQAWKNMNAGVWFNCAQEVEGAVLAGNRIGALTFCWQGGDGPWAGVVRQSAVASSTDNRAGVAPPREFFGAQHPAHSPSAFHGPLQDRVVVPNSYPVVGRTRFDAVTTLGF